jgi:Ser/Thr protein kinase RdoA (MazF antagonist)
VPEVFDVSGADIVMERAAGPTMLDYLGRRPWALGAQARQLARLHGLVHQAPADGPALPLPFGYCERDRHVLLHRDLHPKNVVLTRNGPMIIDWEGAAHGPAIADVAMTWAIIRVSEVPGPRIEAATMRALRMAFTRAFLRAAGPVDDDWRMTAIRLRLADPKVLPSEAARLEKLHRITLGY